MSLLCDLPHYLAKRPTYGGRLVPNNVAKASACRRGSLCAPRKGKAAPAASPRPHRSASGQRGLRP